METRRIVEGFVAALVNFVLVLAVHALPAVAQTFTVLHVFTGQSDGEYPQGSLVKDGGGNLYGGTNASIYKFSPRSSGGIMQNLYRFLGPPDGLFPNGVVIGPDGALYGTTQAGGIGNCHDGAGCGMAFRLHPPSNPCRSVSCSWIENKMTNFFPQTGWLPENSTAVFDAQGNMYGTASQDEQNGAGVVYELSRSGGGWLQTVIYRFTGLSDGSGPIGGLTMDAAGNLYGTTTQGGDLTCYSNLGCGTVYKLSRSGNGWIEQTLHAFHTGEGQRPTGNLVLDAQGNLYGATTNAGPNGGGTVFALSSGSWNFSLLAPLVGSGSDATGPTNGLIMDAAGNLYGATENEGSFHAGSVFKLTPSQGGWTFITLYEFTGGLDGYGPFSNLVIDGSGNIFGTTLEGGGTGCVGFGCGVIFEISQNQ